MQKKLIALAVATLASGAVFAQSNVQIYGSVDMGLSFRSSSQGDAKSQAAIDSGISAGNRLGFTGTEDLGGGLKALFQLEAGFQADTGYLNQASELDDGKARLFGRQAFVGLTGDWGTAIAGRIYTPHYSFISAIDPFKAGTVGKYNNTYGADAAPLGGLLVDPVRVDNTIAYVSPSWSGFNVTLAYSNNAIDNEGIVGQGGSNQNRVYAIFPRYTNGPVDIALNYHQIKMADSLADLVGFDKVTNWFLGGTYDFNVAKLSALYSSTKFNYDDDALKFNNWLLGVNFPFAGKSAIQLSYNNSKASEGDWTGKAQQYAIGYTYDISKRTNFYAAYAHVTNKKVDDVYQRGASVGDASNGGNDYRSGLQFGIKHKF